MPYYDAMGHIYKMIIYKMIIYKMNYIFIIFLDTMISMTKP